MAAVAVAFAAAFAAAMSPEALLMALSEAASTYVGRLEFLRRFACRNVGQVTKINGGEKVTNIFSENPPEERR